MQLKIVITESLFEMNVLFVKIKELNDFAL